MTLIDSYDDTVTRDSVITANWTGSGSRSMGQSFRPSGTYILTSCKFYLKKIRSPSGNLRAYVYNGEGIFPVGIPTGSPLDTSDTLDITALTSIYVLKEFTFSGGAVLSNGGNYCVVLYSTDGILSGSQYIRIGSMLVGSHEGRGMRYLSAFGIWQNYEYVDMLFYIYGNEEIEEIKALPDLASYGWYSTTEEWLRVAVDEDGILQTN